VSDSVAAVIVEDRGLHLKVVGGVYGVRVRHGSMADSMQDLRCHQCAVEKGRP
jgi:hypothetical protein